MKKTFFTAAAAMIAILMLYVSGTLSSSAGNLNDNGLQQSQNKDKGIGPFQNVTLQPVDKGKAKTGLSVFTSKCTLCHELDINKVGPPLRNVIKNYSPEFILNMIVNPLEMQKNNATVKELLKKYNNVPMPDQKISEQDALNILEYLRSVAK
jgi:cytochrome c